MESESANLPQEVNKQTKIYDIEGENVAVTWKQFSPKEQLIEDPDKKSAVIFNTGWSLNAIGKSVAPLCQEFADFTGVSAIAIDTRGEQPNATQMQGAEAIRRFIEENGYTDITIVGNSQGSIRAVNEVGLLQEQNPDINISGLVLMESMGLYEQSGIGLATNFARDAYINTPATLAKHPIKNWEAVKQGVRLASDSGSANIREAAQSRTEFHARMGSEIQEMVTPNPQLAELHGVPIVMIHGEQDLLSNPSKIIPTEEINQRQGAEMPVRKAREEHLKDTLLPQAEEGITFLKAEKLGHHNVPYLRPEQVARSSIYALDRLRRDKGLPQVRRLKEPVSA